MKKRKANASRSAVQRLVELTPEGHVMGVRCRNKHDGEKTLIPAASGYFECQGCGEFKKPERVLAVQRAKGRNGMTV